MSEILAGAVISLFLFVTTELILLPAICGGACRSARSHSKRGNYFERICKMAYTPSGSSDYCVSSADDPVRDGDAGDESKV